jgi:hypothetical protein
MRGLFAAALLVVVALADVPAMSRDVGQWSGQSERVQQWFEHLMQPDNPAVSCCGEADAYFADSYDIAGDRYVAIITDDRPDKPLKRRHVEPGTRIDVPNAKIKWDAGNPTGHGVIFLGTDGFVWCYLPPGGV